MEDKNGVSAEHEDSLNTLTMEQDDSTSEENDSQVLKRQLKETQLALSRCQRQLEKSQQYNEELRQQIENLSSELHVFRSAAQRQQDAEVQVVEKDIAEAYGDKPFPDWSLSGQSSQASEGSEDVTRGIAESLKAAAEEAVWEQAGFVYDSASGLYYDYNSGYYYDSERSLYYDPSTTCYFYYDEGEQSYKFHSYASGQYIQTEQQGTTETDTSQNKMAAAQDTPESARGRGSKRKMKEKPKVHGKRVLKRRRTKSSKHKVGASKGEKVEVNRKDGGHADIGKTVAEDSDEGGEGNKREQTNNPEDGEIIEVESSSSLATGESEMESEPESGEVTDQSTTASSEAEDNDCELCASPVPYDASAVAIAEPEVSASYPPCIRVVVQASETLAVGTFFLVTCTGGTLGRDKDPRHAIQVPDVNVSKVHAEIRFDSDNKCYTVEDLGSQNGTFINELRISESKEKSAAIPLCHGDILRVADTRLLLHIHPGNETCDSCEPGQVLAALHAQQAAVSEHVVLSKADRKKQARQQLKDIKKKYGLANSAYVDDVAALKNPSYADKAELRRRFVGSEHPSHQERHEPPASVHRPLSSANKGHRMLSKMGWTQGSGLGKDSTGRAEPVSVELRANQTAGLGSESSAGVSLDNVQATNRVRRQLQTRERYQRLENKQGCGDTGAALTSAVGGAGKTVDRVKVGGVDSTSKTSSKFQIKWIQGNTQHTS